MNNKYTITIGSPLLRPGLTIMTGVSERYLVHVTHIMMAKVREINEAVERAQANHAAIERGTVPK